MERHLTIIYEFYENTKELDAKEQNLVRLAVESCNNAYAPYSKFKVGAVALLENGDLIKGNNQENIAYPSGLCAERVALFYAGANFPGMKVKTLCIVAEGDLLPKEQILSPCGACRQVMIETEMRQDEKMRVILVNQIGQVIAFSSVLDLLPLAFGVKV